VEKGEAWRPAAAAAVEGTRRQAVTLLTADEQQRAVRVHVRGPGGRAGGPEGRRSARRHCLPCRLMNVSIYEVGGIFPCPWRLHAVRDVASGGQSAEMPGRRDGDPAGGGTGQRGQWDKGVGPAVVRRYRLKWCVNEWRGVCEWEALMAWIRGCSSLRRGGAGISGGLLCTWGMCCFEPGNREEER